MIPSSHAHLKSVRHLDTTGESVCLAHYWPSGQELLEVFASEVRHGTRVPELADDEFAGGVVMAPCDRGKVRRNRVATSSTLRSGWRDREPSARRPARQACGRPEGRRAGRGTSPARRQSRCQNSASGHEPSWPIALSHAQREGSRDTASRSTCSSACSWRLLVWVSFGCSRDTGCSFGCSARIPASQRCAEKAGNQTPLAG